MYLQPDSSPRNSNGVANVDRITENSSILFDSPFALGDEYPAQRKSADTLIFNRVKFKASGNFEIET